MEGPYGSEWQEEEKVKRREMVDPEARYIFVHVVANSNVDDMTTVLTEEDTSTSRQEDSSPLVGFVHYRFVLEEDVPVLYVYIISATSPSKVNPMLEKSYEILCRTFDDEAKTIFEVI
ncbi:N-alpha-acetyltransferase 40-like [Trifolium medium]|uniref:N-alpha-acetyltransferase 40-like n=1 Tax=Trifolium medium TaxID=97028 RepID=A0A392MA40_9FABA|nr:N-alpha-acetyltransferase 40-like [Trifolium medium]